MYRTRVALPVLWLMSMTTLILHSNLDDSLPRARPIPAPHRQMKVFEFNYGFGPDTRPDQFTYPHETVHQDNGFNEY